MKLLSVLRHLWEETFFQPPRRWRWGYDPQIVFNVVVFLFFRTPGTVFEKNISNFHLIVPVTLLLSVRFQMILTSANKVCIHLCLFVCVFVTLQYAEQCWSVPFVTLPKV